MLCACKSHSTKAQKSNALGATGHIDPTQVLNIYKMYPQCVDFCRIPHFRSRIVRDKRQKFVDLAEARVNRAMKDLQLIGNLSNKAAYEFTDPDVKKIFGALQKALDSARSRFTKDGEIAGGEFRL